MPLEVNTLLNERYVIHDIIAQGGMSALYRAHDLSLSIDVAVKENLYLNPEHVRQFRREASILAGLRHPNLPRVTDHFTIPQQGQYLVMDYVEGEDLRERTERTGCVEPGEAVRIGAAVCDALEYLHGSQPPILHRDVKPGNIKLTPDGQVMLVDFGLARRVSEGQSTTVGAQSFTPGFAPPEQYGHGTDERSDIYALCATLYAALSGSVPTDGLSRVMGTADLAPLQVQAPMLPAALSAVIEQGMSINPQDRFSSASELRQALLAAWSSSQAASLPPQAAQNPVPAGAASPTPVWSPTGQIRRWSERLSGIQPWFSRRHWPVFGLVGVIVLSGAAGLLTLRGSRQPAAVPTQTTHPAAAAPSTARPGAAASPALTAIVQAPPVGLPSASPTPEMAGDPTALPLPAAVTTPLGGGTGLLAFASNASGIPQVYISDPDGGSVRQLTSMPEGACQPDWSPDGQRLVFISPCAARRDQYPGASLYLINLDGSGLLPLDTDPGGDFEPAWSPDGTTIAFTSLRDGRPHIFLYHLADETVTGLSRKFAYDRQPAWSPDGSQIAYSTYRAELQQVWIMNSDGSQPHEFSPVENGIAFLPLWSPDGQDILFSQGDGAALLYARPLNSPTKGVPVTVLFVPIVDADFSPDGSWLVFESWPDKNHEIYRMTRTGTQVIPLTDTDAIEFDPAWGP